MSAQEIENLKKITNQQEAKKKLIEFYANYSDQYISDYKFESHSTITQLLNEVFSKMYKLNLKYDV